MEYLRYSQDHPCTIEEVSHHTQKERRIIDTLEPVMAAHRLIIDRTQLDEDYQSAQKYDSEVRIAKTLIHQLTRICYDRGALRFDDRLDALAIGVNYWVERMARDQERTLKALRDEKLQKELDRYLEGAILGGNGGRRNPCFI